MVMSSNRLVLALVFGVAACPLLNAQDAREVAKLVLPSVVLIEVYDRTGSQLALGSGFFVAPNLIVTNQHVVAGGTTASSRLVGSRKTCNILGTMAIDSAADLALLRADCIGERPLKIGQRNALHVGEAILAVGNPEGLDGTISLGIVSGFRTFSGSQGRLIQITAPISGGSSGGPLVNLQGEVVGVIVASLKRGQNLNFAVPVEYLSDLLARTRNLRPLPEAGSEPATRTPTLAETEAWLSSRLNGAYYMLPATRETEEATVTLKSFTVSECNIQVVKTDQIKQFGATISTSFPAGWIANVGFGINNAGYPSLQLDLDRAVKDRLEFSNGQSVTQSKAFVNIPMLDLSIGARSARAIQHLRELCVKQGVTEPF